MKFLSTLFFFLAFANIQAQTPSLTLIESESEWILHIPEDNNIDNIDIDTIDTIDIENDEGMNKEYGTEFTIERDRECLVHIPTSEFSNEEVWIEQGEQHTTIPGTQLHLTIPTEQDPYSFTSLTIDRSTEIQIFSDDPSLLEIIPLPLAKDPYDLANNPYISEEDKKRITPYLLQTSHVAYTVLDPVFRAKRATYDRASFAKAGFTHLVKRPALMAGYHKNLINYVVKAEKDTTAFRPKRSLITRVEHAHQMLQVIKQYDIKHVTVPHKWIYPLPLKPNPPSGTKYRKGLVVIAERVKFLSRSSSLKLWRKESTWTERMLDEIFILLSNVPLGDTGFHNLRFAPDKTTIVFYDLEFPGHGFEQFNRKMASRWPRKWRDYWKTLLETAKHPTATSFDPDYEYEEDEGKDKNDPYDLANNPYISEKNKEAIAPHLLPTSHPAYIALDPIFRATRATYNDKTFSKAGFVSFSDGQKSMLVGYHETLPDYIVKAGQDTRHSRYGRSLASRVTKAHKIRQLIQEYNMQHIAVPQKWAYPLPLTPNPPEGTKHRKGFIVIAERMNFLSHENSDQLWRSESTWTEQMLDELFIIITKAHLGIMACHNMRFAQDKKTIVFFDLERTSKDWKHTWYTIHAKLPDKWKGYWKLLLRQRKTFEHPSAPETDLDTP